MAETLYYPHGKMEQAVALANAGDIGKCLVELHKLRDAGYPAAASQLALLEKELCDDYINSTYYWDLLNEAQKNGHAFACGYFYKKRWINKGLSIKRAVEKIVYLRRVWRGFFKHEYLEIHPFEIPKTQGKISEEQEIWLGQAKCQDMLETKKVDNYILSAWARDRHEFELVLGCRLRLEGLNVVSINALCKIEDATKNLISPQTAEEIKLDLDNSEQGGGYDYVFWEEQKL